MTKNLKKNLHVFQMYNPLRLVGKYYDMVHSSSPCCRTDSLNKSKFKALITICETTTERTK